jgi:hypothetical protein
MKRSHLALLASAVVAFGGALWGGPWGADALAAWQSVPRQQAVLTTDALVGLGAGLVALSALLGVPQRRRQRERRER